MNTKIAEIVPFEQLEKEAIPNLIDKLGPKPTVGDIITNVIPIVMFFAGVVFLIMTIISGFNLMTSSGDPQKAKAAQSRLTNALIGLLFVFFAYWIVRLIGYLFDIQGIRNIFG